MDEDVLKFDCFDEDVKNNDFIGAGEIKISEITDENGKKVIEVKDEKGSVGKLTISYMSTNIIKKEEPPKPEEKPKEDTSRRSSFIKGSESKIQPKQEDQQPQP